MSCRYWEPVFKNSALCRKTDFIDRCKCGGDQSKCDFPDKRQKTVEEPKFGEWISVKDRLPEHNQKVLAYTAESQGTYEEYRLCFGWAIKGHVTHWMPLPEQPKG